MEFAQLIMQSEILSNLPLICVLATLVELKAMGLLKECENDIPRSID